MCFVIKAIVPEDSLTTKFKVHQERAEQVQRQQQILQLRQGIMVAIGHQDHILLMHTIQQLQALLPGQRSVVNFFDQGQTTPLVAAIRTNNAVTVYMLLNSFHADPNFAAMDSNFPLHEACRDGNLTIIRNLLEAGANPNQCNSTGETPLHVVCAECIQPSAAFIVDSLLKAGAKPTIADDNGTTPLMHAADNPLTLEMLIAYGAELNKQDELGNTALHHALLSEEFDGAEYLLLRDGIQVLLKNKKRELALQLAIERSNTPKSIEKELRQLTQRQRAFLRKKVKTIKQRYGITPAQKH